MPVLRELNLDQNELEEIPAEFRFAYSSLMHVLLLYFLLSWYECSFTFLQLRKWRMLPDDTQGMTACRCRVFFSSSRRRYLTRLEVLSIKNNRIAHINYHFCSLTQLRELSLSHNELKVRVQRGIAQRNKRARTRAHTHTSRPTHMHIHTFANPPKHEIMRIVSAALARVSESHGGKPPRRRRRRSLPRSHQIPAA